MKTSLGYVADTNCRFIADSELFTAGGQLISVFAA